jgi:hypothetical protein
MTGADLAECIASATAVALIAHGIIDRIRDRRGRRRERIILQLLAQTAHRNRTADESWERLQRLVACRCTPEGAPEDPEPFGGRLNLPPRLTSENVGGQVQPAPKSPRDEYPYA